MGNGGCCLLVPALLPACGQGRKAKALDFVAELGALIRGLMFKAALETVDF